MCLGNRAEASVVYVNSQLRALYENAQVCVRKHGTGLKPTSNAIEYGTCLCEYYGPGKHANQNPSKHDLAFFVSFGCPHIEFVCNHEVILYLTLVDGHYHRLQNSRPNGQREIIEECTIAFRVPFIQSDIKAGHIKHIGNAAEYTITLLVLDLESATFARELSNVSLSPIGAHEDDDLDAYIHSHKLEAITHYLTKHYFTTIRRGGHHVLYSLPDFDNLGITTSRLDYSVISTNMLSTHYLFDVHVDKINEYLCGLWLQAAAARDDIDAGLSPSDSHLAFLAEQTISSPDELDDLNLHLCFGPIQIRPLCHREVILSFNITDIFVGSIENSKHHLHDWKIAFICDVDNDTTDREAKRITLNIKSARICEQLSEYTQIENISIFTRVRYYINRYLSTTYLQFMERTETIALYCFYKSVGGRHTASESECESSEEEDEEWDVNGCRCVSTTVCGHSEETTIRWGILERHMLTHTTCGDDFDMITSLSQGALNDHFTLLWDTASYSLKTNSGAYNLIWHSAERVNETCLAAFSAVHADHGDEVFFSARFNAPNIQLICSSPHSTKVVFYLNITEGQMKTLGLHKCLQPDGPEYKFHMWRLAFEVDLMLIDSSEAMLPDIIMKRLGLKGSSGTKQLVMDLAHARFKLALSDTPGLLRDTDIRAIRSRREALVYYIQREYFPALVRAKHHVLYTIPVHDDRIPDISRYSLSAVGFEIVPFHSSHSHNRPILDGLFGRYSAIYERNAIVIFGTFGGRPLPSCGLPSGVNWICGGLPKVGPFGAVHISRSTFLEKRLFMLLERFNRETTIVPSFSGVNNGEWILVLTTWGNHALKANTSCRFNQRISKDDTDHLTFEWINNDVWRYEHESDIHHKDTYTVQCKTTNLVLVPTTRQERCSIQVRGKLLLGLSYSGKHASWANETTVTWQTSINLSSSSSGIEVRLSSTKVEPRIVEAQSKHDAPGATIYSKILSHLRGVFPAILDFSSLASELKVCFEGGWTGVFASSCELVVVRPMFNSHGDLVLELAARGATEAQRRPERFTSALAVTTTPSAAAAASGTMAANGDGIHAKSPSGKSPLGIGYFSNFLSSKKNGSKQMKGMSRTTSSASIEEHEETIEQRTVMDVHEEVREETAVETTEEQVVGIAAY